MTFSVFQKRVMLDWIRERATRGQPCPSNIEISDRFEFASGSSAVRLLQEMEAAGLLRIERFSHARVATVVATGESTARPANPKPHWRDRAGSTKAKTKSARADARPCEAATHGAAVAMMEPPSPRPGDEAAPSFPSAAAPPRPSLADIVRQEAEGAAERRRDARATGTVRRPLAINGEACSTRCGAS